MGCCLSCVISSDQMKRNQICVMVVARVHDCKIIPFDVRDGKLWCREIKTRKGMVTGFWYGTIQCKIAILRFAYWDRSLGKTADPEDASCNSA